MKFNIAYSDISERSFVNPDYLSRGDVVAFSDGECTGLFILESRDVYFYAIRQYYGSEEVWVYDQIPCDAILYVATDEEKDFGRKYFFEHMYANASEDERHPVIAFIENECTATVEYEASHQLRFCKEVLVSLPRWGYLNDDKTFINKVWREAIKGTNEGLAFNPYRAELYCFLIAILMIRERSEPWQHDYFIDKLCTEWEHFVWMYSMVVGRLIGTELKTFTSMVNTLDNNKRRRYIRLYLSLIEGNVEKICRYSAVEKPYKLVEAIRKMRVTEERIEQSDHLDDLYQILFPKHFCELMSNNRPSSTIKEMKEELAKKDEQINHWKKAAEDLSAQVNQLTEGMKKKVEESLSMEDVSTAILAMRLDIAKIVYSNLDFKLRKNEVWRRGRDTLLDKLEEKENAANRPLTLEFHHPVEQVIGHVEHMTTDYENITEKQQ